MHLFFTPDISADFYQLSEEESKHCVRVLRLVKSDIVFLIDGKGGLYKTEIIDDHPKRCILKVLEKRSEYGKRPFKLHVAIAPTKNMDRLEWFLEKITEIGVDEITPLICQRSERRELKIDRLQKIIVAAMKQSLKAYQPVLNEPLEFRKLINSASESQKLIAHCLETDRKSLSQEYRRGENVLILIGPEGDFSPEEIEAALKSDFKAVTLGNSRLRTETAGVVACAQLNFMNE
ncbi:16S rRNA (uracil(1498)-N(3))-methyltransferase [Solitalea koreensis]|uniref:Ribosomal RNA small subunit methyltransferase E n=1 Tax=Solitalea koreensis TaxID=543615 RepID=A0A521C6U1_9SPHI|nr:16S rRNA (uracil(1498)-N(3))-methyltransferase [Solitalea koreensis]SMO55085.1 16S rRNA (uracil1498-N3)-methyltransferase [Solitalea koreensis]